MCSQKPVLQAEELSPGFSKTVRLCIAKVKPILLKSKSKSITKVIWLNQVYSGLSGNIINGLFVLFWIVAISSIYVYILVIFS